MASLFAQRQGGPRPLVTFRAGRMFKEDGLVKPDKRKGQVSVVLQESLLHFQWKDRATGAIEDDLIIFPDEATFYKVEKCTTGRVYLLDFKDSTRLFFYWMQEPSDAKDQEHCEKIGQLLNNPNAALSNPGGGLGAMNLSQLDRNQLLGLLAGFQGQTPPEGSTQSSRRAGPASARAPVELSTLQGILSGLNLPPASPAAAEGNATEQPAPESQEPAEGTTPVNATPDDKAAEDKKPEPKPEE